MAGVIFGDCLFFQMLNAVDLGESARRPFLNGDATEGSLHKPLCSHSSVEAHIVNELWMSLSKISRPALLVEVVGCTPHAPASRVSVIARIWYYRALSTAFDEMGATGSKVLP